MQGAGRGRRGASRPPTTGSLRGSQKRLDRERPERDFWVRTMWVSSFL